MTINKINWYGENKTTAGKTAFIYPAGNTGKNYYTISIDGKKIATRATPTKVKQILNCN